MLCDELLPDRFGNAEHDRRPHRARCDGAHPDAERGEITRQRKGHAEDRGLRRGVGQLAGLSLDARDRGRVHDHAALAVLVGLVGGHRRGREPGDVERADCVHLHRRDERFLVVRRAVAADGPAAAHPATGDVHDERERADASRAASIAA